MSIALDLSFLPLAIGGVTLVAWDGASYVAEDGRTFWTAASPSADDAVLAVISPRNPPAPDQSVPVELPAWRIKAVADLAGLTPAIEAALAALPQPARTVATRAWSEGNVIRRDSATVQSLAAALGLTAAQVDDMFRQAATLEV